MVEIICAVIAAFSAIMVAYVGAKMKQSNEEQKKIEERTVRRAELRKRESLLLLKMVDATLLLSIVSSNALTNGVNNGNVAKAKEAAEEAKEAYEEFMMEMTAHQISKQ